jgi:lipoprotein-anchoring transpeptidase ErfK/SrfK
VCALVGPSLAACGGSGGGREVAAASPGVLGGSQSAPAPVRLTITPASGSVDTRPNLGIMVSASGGRIGRVKVGTDGHPVTGTLNAAGTVWHSTWALDVGSTYTVTATATSPSGTPMTETDSFRTSTPKSTFSTEILEGSRQTYGIGMPIILYFSRTIADRAAVERSLQVTTSRHIEGAWYWDSECGSAPVCLYFRPRHFWPPHTRITFTGHLDGVEVAPGVFGDHTLTQTFRIGQPLLVVASAATHHMKVYRDRHLFARWPISTGRPGLATPDGVFLTIDKANPVDMVGPGYNIEVPWSVRFTWSGDFLHDAYWSVGEQGFTNVSHGCVNMPPADAEIYYKMAVPGDPVIITGSPLKGTFDDGWTEWFLPWHRYEQGSALHEAVLAGPHGSRFIKESA